MIKQSSNGNGTIRVVMFFHFFLLTRISNRKNSTCSSVPFNAEVGHITKLVRDDSLWFPALVAGSARYRGSKRHGAVVASQFVVHISCG